MSPDQHSVASRLQCVLSPSYHLTHCLTQGKHCIWNAKYHSSDISLGNFLSDSSANTIPIGTRSDFMFLMFKFCIIKFEVFCLNVFKRPIADVGPRDHGSIAENTHDVISNLYRNVLLKYVHYSVTLLEV